MMAASPWFRRELSIDQSIDYWTEIANKEPYNEETKWQQINAWNLVRWLSTQRKLMNRFKAQETKTTRCCSGGCACSKEKGEVRYED